MAVVGRAEKRALAPFPKTDISTAMTVVSHTASDHVPPLSLRWIMAAALLVLAIYGAVLLVARDLGPGEAIMGAMANTLPIILLGLAARSLILKFVVGQPGWRVALLHGLLGVSFAVLSYWMLLVLLGVMYGVSATEFDVRPFGPRAMAWQSLQNLTTYGLIAALTHLQASVARAQSADAPQAANAADSSGRYFVRIGDDIRPIDLAEIISIVGADDYTELRLRSGRHLVRMTLGEFAATLDPGRFARVHRSRIVNLERIDRAEPAGNGRLLLHMEDGDLIQTSRAGARLVRDRVI